MESFDKDIGPFCSELSITMDCLEHIRDFIPCSIPDVSNQLTNGAVLELLKLLNCGFTLKDLLLIHNSLIPDNQISTAATLNKRWNKLKQQHIKLNKTSQDDALAFLKQLYSHETAQPQTRIRKNTTEHKSTEKSLRRSNEELKTNINQLSDEKHALLEVIEKFNNKPDGHESSISKTKHQNLKRKCEEQVKVIKRIKTTNYYRRLKRQEMKLHHSQQAQKIAMEKLKRKLKKIKAEMQVEQKKSVSQVIQFKRERMELRKQKKQLQTRLSELGKRPGKEKNKIEDLRVLLKKERQEKKNLQEELRKQEKQVLEMDTRYLKTRCGDHSNAAFTDEVRQTVMELQAKQVASNKIGDVIQIVANNLFDVKLAKEDVPKKSSACYMADEAHFLGKRHIAERLLQAKKWDLHSDGTSRDGAKVLDFEVTLDTKETLSCGFLPVAEENSQTVLQATKSLFDELSDYLDTNNKDALTTMLSSMANVVSDRSSVMKKYHQLLSEWRDEQLEGATEVQATKLNYFYCNAHFLLGLSSQAEKALQEYQKILESLHGKLGRDALPAFRLWNCSESAVLRLLRTACEAFGPRGDQKSGCRADWLAYLQLNDRKSYVPSYRGNRFNNMFLGAACIYHHRHDILAFLTKGYRNRNKLLDSIAADIQSPSLIAGLRSLGMLYYHITSPLWNLIRGSMHVLDLHIPFTNMYEMFGQLCLDGTYLMSVDIQPVFGPEYVAKRDDVCSSVFEECDATLNSMTVDFIEVLSASSRFVTAKQLEEYLPGGKYTSHTEVERQNTQHTRKENLASENDFGHFDYDCHQKPNANLRHHSSVLINKINHTFDWFDGKAPEEKKELMKLARKMAPKVKEYGERREEEVKNKRKEKLNESRRKEEEKQQKLCTEKQQLIDRVISYGGPCRSKDDIHDILQSKSIKEKHEILKSELKYHKLVIGVQVDKKLFNFSEKGQQHDITTLTTNLETVLSAITTSPTAVESHERVDMSNDEYKRKVEEVKMKFLQKITPASQSTSSQNNQQHTGDAQTVNRRKKKKVPTATVR